VRHHFTEDYALIGHLRQGAQGTNPIRSNRGEIVITEKNRVIT